MDSCWWCDSCWCDSVRKETEAETSCALHKHTMTHEHTTTHELCIAVVYCSSVLHTTTHELCIAQAHHDTQASDANTPVQLLQSHLCVGGSSDPEPHKLVLVIIAHECVLCLVSL